MVERISWGDAWDDPSTRTLTMTTTNESADLGAGASTADIRTAPAG